MSEENHKKKQWMKNTDEKRPEEKTRYEINAWGKRCKKVSKRKNRRSKVVGRQNVMIIVIVMNLL